MATHSSTLAWKIPHQVPLVDYSPWGHKESDTTKQLHLRLGELWRRKWQPTPVFLPGKVHGQRSLGGCSLWGYMTEHVCMRVEGDGLVAIKW